MSNTMRERFELLVERVVLEKPAIRYAARDDVARIAAALLAAGATLPPQDDARTLQPEDDARTRRAKEMQDRMYPGARMTWMEDGGLERSLLCAADVALEREREAERRGWKAGVDASFKNVYGAAVAYRYARIIAAGPFEANEGLRGERVVVKPAILTVKP